MNGVWAYSLVSVIIVSLISLVGILGLSLIYVRFDSICLLRNPMSLAGFPGWVKDGLPATSMLSGVWYTFGMRGIDWRPALPCIIGVFLAIAMGLRKR